MPFYLEDFIQKSAGLFYADLLFVIGKSFAYFNSLFKALFRRTIFPLFLKGKYECLREVWTVWLVIAVISLSQKNKRKEKEKKIAIQFHP